MRMTQISSVLIATAAAVIVACSGSNQPPVAEAEPSGQLDLALVGTASDGTSYRLRNADFELYGYPDYYEVSTGESGAGGGGGWDDYYYYDEFSTEDDPDAVRISKKLVPGYYYVYLTSSDWYLEELTPSGPVRVEEAVLLSSRYNSTYVYNNGTSRIYYRFGAHGDIIDFRSGDLEIGIQVELPGDDDGYGGEGWGGFSGTGGSPSGGFGGAF